MAFIFYDNIIWQTDTVTHGGHAASCIDVPVFVLFAGVDTVYWHFNRIPVVQY